MLGRRICSGKGIIARNETEKELVLVDQPDVDDSVTRVSGPFVVEAILPTPLPLDPADAPAAPEDAPADHIARMIEVLRRSPMLALPGGGKVTLKSIRRPGRTLNLSAEAVVEYASTEGAVIAGEAKQSRATGEMPVARPWIASATPRNDGEGLRGAMTGGAWDGGSARNDGEGGWVSGSRRCI